MRPVTHTLIDSVSATATQVFAMFADPRRIAQWLPGCQGAEGVTPLRKGARFKAKFGGRTTEFEIVDFAEPATFGWAERGGRRGTKLFLRLDPGGTTTAITVREVWTPTGFFAWLRGRFFERRDVRTRLQAIIDNLRKLATVC